MKKRNLLKLLGATLGAVVAVATVSCGGSKKSKPDIPGDNSGETGGGQTGGGQTGGGQTGDTEGKITMNNVEYATITAALTAIPETSTDTFVIKLPKGTYKENGLHYKGSATIIISGDTTTKYAGDVVIEGVGADQNSNKTRPLLEVEGSGNLVLENLTLKNTFTRKGFTGSGTQCEALGFDSKDGTVAAYNCSFLSHQDTVRTIGKAWFYGCYIEGDVDFIWCEAQSKVALYEECKIKAVGDETTEAYVAAPKYNLGDRVGKGLVVYNSEVIIDEALTKAALFRNPWSDTEHYNTVAYVGTTVTGTLSSLSKNAGLKPSDDLGYKIDEDLAAALSAVGDKSNVSTMSAEQKTAEYAGRNNIINRMYDVNTKKFSKDLDSNWDVAALVTARNWTVTADTSKDQLDGEDNVVVETYLFNGTQDVAALVNNFASHSSGSFTGKTGATITIPVSGKCTVSVSGFYSGVVETKADTQNVQTMFFNNGNTNTEMTSTYFVYDDAATSVVITAKDTTYITKIRVEYDDTIVETKVADLTITPDKTNFFVGVANSLKSTVTNDKATNKSVLWSSSDETIAKIDKYTGKISFLKEGNVVFTATTLDGSGVEKTFNCSPISPDYDTAEWYSVDNKNMAEESTATNIKYFTPTTSYKALATVDGNNKYSFNDLTNDEITTVNGLKLNSAGKLEVYIPREATLTIVIDSKTSNAIDPFVHKDGVLGEDGKPVYLTATKIPADRFITYTYEITSSGTYVLDRGVDTTSEINPVVYAKVECKAVDYTVKQDTEFNFRKNNTTVEENHFYAFGADSTSPFYGLTLTGASSNGGDWLKFNSGATASFEVAGACKITVNTYSTGFTAKLGDETVTVSDVTTETGNGRHMYEIVLTKAGVVTLTSDASNYIGYIKVDFE